MLGWFSPPPPEQISPLGRALKANDLHGVMQDQFMLFTVDCLVLFCVVGVNFLQNGVCVFVVAKTQLSEQQPLLREGSKTLFVFI